MPIGAIWQTALETPLINIMVVLTVVLGGSYGAAILAFTVISRALMFPLTLRMLHSMKGLQDIQPQMQDIQKKYTDPRRRQEEVMKLYKEAGVNPLGCLGPQLIQFPVFIALYQVIQITLGRTPEGVLELSRRLYDYPIVQDAIPLSSTFFGIDMAANGNYLLVAIVFASMWLQQRISTNRNAAASTEQQRQMNQMMQWMMPAMFSWFVIATPAGVGLYWAASTIIGVVLQLVFVGPGDFTWGSLIPGQVRDRIGMRRSSQRPDGRRAGARAALNQHAEVPAGDRTESRTTDASSRDQRQNGRRGNRAGSESTGPASRASRRRRHH
ncbi:MAG: YidC/Oxa1 family membrane protein insertase [Dehalococcoidia bacterium]|nr:YidC/Oxa1 family membrane protein insertase [Dehalococcoidia bacterium]